MRSFLCVVMWVIAASLLTLSNLVPLPSALAQDVAAAGSDLLVHHLEDFGPLSNPAEVQQTWQAAREAMEGKAGVLVVPPRVWPMLKPDSLQSLIRIPEAPAPAKTWRHGAGMAVLTADSQRPMLHVPPLSGVGVSREFRLNDGDSAPHWGTHPMLTRESKIVYGSVSYLHWLQAPTEAGTARHRPTVLRANHSLPSTIRPKKHRKEIFADT